MGLKHHKPLGSLFCLFSVWEYVLKVDDLLRDVPRDCKNLQDLLSDVQVLIHRGQFHDVRPKMTVAEQLRNKCAASNNTLQQMLTTKMRKVTHEGHSMEEIEPASLKRLLQAEELLTSVLEDFEQTHKVYIWQLDRMFSFKTNWDDWHRFGYRNEQRGRIIFD